MLPSGSDYNLYLVPGGSLPELSSAFGIGAYEKILQHELVGHGLNNWDEYAQKGWRKKYIDAWGTPPEDDSIMNNLRTPDGAAGLVFYSRHWRAGLFDESNIPGHEIIVDSTHWLNAQDSWWSQGDMGTLERVMVQGLIE